MNTLAFAGNPSSDPSLYQRETASRATAAERQSGYSPGPFLSFGRLNSGIPARDLT